MLESSLELHSFYISLYVIYQISEMKDENQVVPHLACLL